MIKEEDDFCGYIENNLIIRSKNRSLSNMILNKEQKHIIRVINNQKRRREGVRIIILKGRQIGSSTLIAARGYYNIIKSKGMRGLVLAHRRIATNNIFDMINRYALNDENIKKGDFRTIRNSSISLLSMDSSYIFATAGSTEVGRSDTIQFFHGSEVAYWSYEENHLSSILMAVPSGEGSEIILESTSNGPSGMFYTMVQECLRGGSEFELVFLPWYMHDEYRNSKEINLPNSWLEYGKQYSLDKLQITWAYSKNRELSVGGEDYDLGPTARFFQEFPASVAEAFMFSKQNILIKLDAVANVVFDAKFYEQKGDKLKVILHKYKLARGEEIILGVDIARGGGDFSWIIDRQGGFIGFNVNYKVDIKDSMELVGLILRYIKRLDPKYVCIDAGGGGVGVYDRLRELGFDKILILVYFGGKAEDDRKYFNKRAEMWGRLKDFIEDGGNAIINDQLLIQQITSAEYFYTSKGQIQLQSKEEIKKKLKHSPDGADACALTFAINSNHRDSMSKDLHYVGGHLDSFDPFNW